MQAYWKQRKPAEAAEALEQAIALKPDAGSYYTELGRALAARRSPAGDDAERAAAILSRAIEIDPADALARYELGKLWMAQGRLPAAAEQLRKAVEAETESTSPTMCWGKFMPAKNGASGRASISRSSKKRRPPPRRDLQ